MSSAAVDGARLRAAKSDAGPGRIVWIASYPKSGNTWMRVFIEHLVSGGGEVDLNRFAHAGEMASSRRLFDRVSGIRASDLTRGEVKSFRPEVYRALSRRAASRVFLKTHDAHDDALFPADATHGAIHIVRNPLDVAVSYAHHVSATPDFDPIITRMCSPRNAMATRPDRLGRHLIVHTGDWSGHASGWSRDHPFPVVTLRYEDLLRDPIASFTRAARLIDAQADAGDVRRAVEHSSFERLRAFELEHGFLERGQRSRAFFRSGRSGMWQEHLSDGQIARLVAAHGAVMRRFGYLDAGGVPVDPAAT